MIYPCGMCDGSLGSHERGCASGGLGSEPLLEQYPLLVVLLAGAVIGLAVGSLIGAIAAVLR